MREPWFAAVRALRETLWSAFSPLFIKTRFEKKQKKKRILKKKHGMKDLPFPPTTNLSRTIRMDFVLEAVMQLQILSRTYDALGKGGPLEGSQAQVSNLDRSGRSGDEDVVTLEVPVDNGRRPGMKEVQPLQNLPAPAAQDFDLHLLKPF